MESMEEFSVLWNFWSKTLGGLRGSDSRCMGCVCSTETMSQWVFHTAAVIVSDFVSVMVASKLCAWWRSVCLQAHGVSLFGPSIWWSSKVRLWFSSLQLLDWEWVSTGLCKLCTLFKQALLIKVFSSGAYKLSILQLLSLTMYTFGAFEASNQDCRLRD